MKSEIWKSTFREIGQSLGRFLAILAIVALGVGFFAGLKVTQPAMIKTTEQYLRKNHFYDYRILSTVGYSKEQVQKFREQEDVWAAEGGISFDILCQGDGGNEKVLKALSIPSEVNQIVVVEGRLPENDSECVVDANLYDASKIGKKIVLSEGNIKDDLARFKNEEYTIVGIVQSPLYIQFERGNTSLGNGSVNGFFYLLPEGFDVDYYTEVYVKFTADFPMYSDDYKDYIERKTKDWETLSKTLAEERYETVLADAEKQLFDGKKELSEKQQEADEKFSDARQQLEDAKEQISDGEKQLSEAKKQLETAPDELAAKEQELADAKTKISEKEAQLDQVEIAMGVLVSKVLAGESISAESIAADGTSLGSDAEGMGAFLDGIDMSNPTAALAQIREQIADGRKQIEAAKQQVKDGEAALAQAKKQLADGQKELKEKEAKLADAEEKYENGKKEYEEGVAEYETAIADAREQISDGEKALEELEEPTAYVLDRYTNVGYVCFESDSGIVDGIANVFPVFFFLVAALVCITTMNRMVEEQRTQIGVLKALGYGEGSIMAKYLFYSGAAAVTGCVLGFALGTWFFPKVIWYAYGMIYRVDTLVYVFDWKMAAISLTVSLLCSVGTTYFCCRKELAEVAAELMRPKAPKAGKRVVLEHIPFIWKRLKFLQKVSVRNVFRYKKRFFMMVVGISGCTALLVTGFGVRDSITNVATQQYTEIETYDMSVHTKDAVDADFCTELEKIEGIAAYAPVMEKSVDLKAGGKTKSINLEIIDAEMDVTPFLNLHTVKKKPIALPGEKEAVISHKIAEDYDISVGDTMTIADENQEEMELTVSGIFQNFVYNYVFISTQTYELETGEQAACKTIWLNRAEGQDVHLLSTVLMNTDGVTAVTVNEDMLERFSNMMRSMDLIVIVIILCAAGLAFIVLYNLTNINITERVREVATIKVLGFYEKETASYVFRENTVLTFLGSLLGLLLGYFLHRFVMSQIHIDLVAFDVHVRPVSYCYSVLLTLAFAWFVNRVMRRKIDSISMTESLKSVD